MAKQKKPFGGSAPGKPGKKPAPAANMKGGKMGLGKSKTKGC